MVAESLVFAAAGLVIIAFLVLIYGLRENCCKRATGEAHPESEHLIAIPDDFVTGQTLKRSVSGKQEDASNGTNAVNKRKFEISRLIDKEDATQPSEVSPPTSLTCSNLVLEVISGPSAGLRLVRESQADAEVSFTIGRIPSNELVLDDPEVSGKHAIISWNSQVSQWELLDLGSLNGTLLNNQSVSAAQPANVSLRQRGHAVCLTNGDVVTLGSTSQLRIWILVNKSSQFSAFPFGVGVAVDPMSIRKGGKKMPMEDVFLCEWPLRGIEHFGVFCIFDGHGGVQAAEATCRIMPQKLSNILAVEGKRMKVLSECDAAEVLRDAFKQTEEALVYDYEGCTATVLLLWQHYDMGYYAQCANVGDSACVFSVGGQQTLMTEDHRLTSTTERARLLSLGKHLRDGENRLCGMNIVRALGDKFLKEQDRCFSAEPYVSKPLKISSEGKGLAIMASDGLWDVLSLKRAINMALEARDGLPILEDRKPVPISADEIAYLLLNTARLLRTKDNISVIVLDFKTSTTHH